MRESKDLEFKETITNSFLKTVSAFANYRNGKIIFGISDNGDIKGISNPVQACLDIENKINKLNNCSQNIINCENIQISNHIWKY